MKKAVIMAGGQGTRLRPLTNHLPKPMVPILSRPCLEYIIHYLMSYGITDIAMTVNYKSDQIKDYFGNGESLGVTITYFDEATPLGTAGGVKNCEYFLDEPFLVISCDNIATIDINKAIQFHQQKKGIATLILTQAEDPSLFGVVKTNDQGKIIQFIEKPKDPPLHLNAINTGIYILEPTILETIPPRQKIDFGKDVFPNLLQKGIPLYGYSSESYWRDIGSLKSYCQTQFDMLCQHHQFPTINKLFSTDHIMIDPSTEIHPTVEIEPPTYIGAHCKIGPHVRIRPHTILGDHVTISQDSILSNTIVWSHVNVGNNVHLDQCIVCHYTWIDDHTHIDRSIITNQCKHSPFT
ncbi:nucleotidyltransferase family protein [Marininema halotolerans]|uniref:Mannose-1-phosphate guanylyltransferase / phosphomannomutase n=1 Tax=Marininema halotolerans TaxID=1155944 RepID=A0A1I6TYX6_9BACL|nr:NDP-sugar synthase [Marininema halotolerans]SFS94443.1 mannose-1-phosphate guanylyltransferase / phosphomannomutase [Marininema halotolerans]